MAQIDWGPVPITQGRSAFFTAEFYDANGYTSVPPGAILRITYTNLENLTQADIVSLAPTGSFFTGTWSSTSANYGLADWTVMASSGSSASQTGQLRIIYP